MPKSLDLKSDPNLAAKVDELISLLATVGEELENSETQELDESTKRRIEDSIPQEIEESNIEDSRGIQDRDFSKTQEYSSEGKPMKFIKVVKQEPVFAMMGRLSSFGVGLSPEETKQDPQNREPLLLNKALVRPAQTDDFEDFLRNSPPSEWGDAIDSPRGDCISAFNSSQNWNRLEDTDYDLVGLSKDGRTATLKDRGTGERSVWQESDGFADYVIEIFGKGFKFVSSSPQHFPTASKSLDFLKVAQEEPLDDMMSIEMETDPADRISMEEQPPALEILVDKGDEKILKTRSGEIQLWGKTDSPDRQTRKINGEFFTFIANINNLDFLKELDEGKFSPFASSKAKAVTVQFEDPNGDQFPPEEPQHSPQATLLAKEATQMLSASMEALNGHRFVNFDPTDFIENFMRAMQVSEYHSTFADRLDEMLQAKYSPQEVYQRIAEAINSAEQIALGDAVKLNSYARLKP